MIEILSNLIKKAGKETLKLYNSNNYKVTTKSNNSPVTNADFLSNKILIEGLNKISVFPILSEETPVEYSIRKNWSNYWIIDPLDGTKDFIAKNNDFTINIALIEKNRPVLGLIYAPVLEDLYFAVKNLGAFKNKQRIFNNSKRNYLIGTHSRFHLNKKTSNFFINNNISEIKTFGSALKFCKLAEGVVDIYPRYTGSMEWDTAAGDIILEEAGCRIIDLKYNQEIRYNRKNLLNNSFIALRKNIFIHELIF